MTIHMKCQALSSFEIKNKTRLPEYFLKFLGIRYLLNGNNYTGYIAWVHLFKTNDVVS